MYTSPPLESLGPDLGSRLLSINTLYVTMKKRKIGLTRSQGILKYDHFIAIHTLQTPLQIVGDLGEPRIVLIEHLCMIMSEVLSTRAMPSCRRE